MLKRIYTKWLGRLFPIYSEHEVEEELRFHLEMQAQELVCLGFTPDRAKAEAMRRFGDLAATRRQCLRVRRRNRATFRAARVLLILLLVFGFLTRVLVADRYVQHMGEILLAIGILGFLLIAVRIARPADLPNGGSTFSSTV